MRGWTEIRESVNARFDWLGAALSAGILVALLVAMTTGNKAGWLSPPILAAFGGSAAMLAAFIWWELRSSAPMLDLRLFKGKTFSFGVSAAFLTFLGSSSALFLMPFYLQNVLGYSAGTRVVSSSIHQLALLHHGKSKEEIGKELRIGHVILVGADVDRDLMRGYVADGFLEVPQTFSIYQSGLGVEGQL